MTYPSVPKLSKDFGVLEGVVEAEMVRQYL